MGQRLPGLRGDGRASHGDMAGTPGQTSEGQVILSLMFELVRVLQRHRGDGRRSDRRCVFI